MFPPKEGKQDSQPNVPNCYNLTKMTSVEPKSINNMSSYPNKCVFSSKKVVYGIERGFKIAG